MLERPRYCIDFRSSDTSKLIHVGARACLFQRAFSLIPGVESTSLSCGSLSLSFQAVLARRR